MLDDIGDPNSQLWRMKKRIERTQPATGDGAHRGPGAESVQLGPLANALGNGSVAIGTGASSDGQSGAAVGDGASAAGARGAAFGRGAHADGDDSAALGRATASGEYSTAAGYAARATHVHSTAIGADANTSDDYELALGIYLDRVVIAGQLNLAAFSAPSGTSDTQGKEGDVGWDDNYLYVKTSAGWMRSPLSTF